MATSDVTHNADSGQEPLTATDTGLGGSEGPEEEEEGAVMTLLEHLEELRHRLFICCLAILVASIIGFIFWERVVHLLTLPLPQIANGLTHNGTSGLVITGIGESFLIALKIALAVGIVLASPVVLYQIGAFITPALTRNERKYALPFSFLGVGLFAIGIVVGFVVLRFPVAWLIQFGNSQFDLLLTADSYFTFVAYFLLAFGLAFELPLVVTFMGVLGIVSSQFLREKRLYILFGLWIFACVVTPGADPYSPVILGIALTLLFELSIILMRIIRR
ncbi:MAG: twin-arginine translocase subunit TatC [Ktedonobacterales bacterium]